MSSPTRSPASQYALDERRRAQAWKACTPSLPTLAREAGRYVDKDGREQGPALGFCLPREYAAWNLLPEVRERALEVFEELQIPWHAGVDGACSNHLLSSQVQCVNALGQMMDDPTRAERAFGDVLGVGRVLPIEPGRHLTFEYNGEEDLLNEGVDGVRTRGAYTTSVDAALLHEHVEGFREILLLEWKYTERTDPGSGNPQKSEERWRRYGELLEHPDCPIRMDLLSWEELQQEPVYQLVRQQLLAWQLERTSAHGAQRVRVVHCSPSGNDAYQQSLTPAAREIGGSLWKVWGELCRTPDRFVALDSSLLLDPAVTSEEYVARYGGERRTY